MYIPKNGMRQKITHFVFLSFGCFSLTAQLMAAQRLEDTDPYLQEDLIRAEQSIRSFVDKMLDEEGGKDRLCKFILSEKLRSSEKDIRMEEIYRKVKRNKKKSVVSNFAIGALASVATAAVTVKVAVTTATVTTATATVAASVVVPFVVPVAAGITVGATVALVATSLVNFFFSDTK